MYQNIQQHQRSNGYYPNQYSGYQPYGVPMEQPQVSIAAYAPQNGTYLKGRPVVSLEEARAAQINLDGSLFVFTDIGNKKIYTKQLNIDGTATLKTYALIEDEIPVSQTEYVTKAEFNQALAQIQLLLNQQYNSKEGEKKPVTLDF